MFNDSENSNNDISPTTAYGLRVARLFAENLVNVVSQLCFNYEEAFDTHGDFTAVFNDETRRAVIYLTTEYINHAWLMFESIPKENVGNILWFNEYVNFMRSLYPQGFNYENWLRCSIILALMAAYLHHCGAEGILNIAAEHIAAIYHSISRSDEMETLELIIQKYAAIQRTREERLQVLFASEADRSAMHTSDQDLNRSSVVIRLENETVRQHQCKHLNNNELMGREKINENPIPNQTFPLCGKSQTSSSAPTARQMHSDYSVCKNSDYDFTAIPGTSRDTSVVADHPYFQSESVLATSSAFKRRISNESEESENNRAKKTKTNCIISNNYDVKNIQNINMDFNAPCSSDSD